MARGSIPDRDITASSAMDSDSSASNARLGNTKAWIPRSDDKHPWIQVNLQYRRNMTAIVTQGFNGSFVKSYYVSYGDDGSNWMNYTVQGKLKVHVFDIKMDINLKLKITKFNVFQGGTIYIFWLLFARVKRL